MGLFWLWKSKETQESIKVITIDDLYPKDTLWKNGWQKYFPTLSYDTLKQLSAQSQIDREAAILYFDTLLKESTKDNGRYFPTSPDANSYNAMSESVKIKHFIDKISQTETYLPPDKKRMLDMVKTLSRELETKNTEKVVTTTQNKIIDSIH